MNEQNQATNKEEETLQDDDFEAEEALSFCDLPLSGESEFNDDSLHYKAESSSSSSSSSSDDHHEEIFEFSSSFNDDHNSDSLTSAEYMIFGGKLLPYRSLNNHQHHQSNNNDLKNNQTIQTHHGIRTTGFHHRRSESVGELRRSHSSEKDHRFIRQSRSLDYSKLQRSSSTAKATVRTSSSVRQTDRRFSASTCFGKCERRPSPAVRPRWRLLMFGMMRAPVPEMEMRDIRNRMSRRSPASMFPALYGGETETVSVKREEGKGSNWRLLRAFGCKGHANAVVTASLGCIPHV